MNKRISYILLFLMVGLVSGCASKEALKVTNDPFEARNRSIHAFNKRVDRTVVRPVAVGYGTAVPEPVRDSVSNFSANLSTPGHVLNNVLQGRLDRAITNSFRFATNTIFGLGGLFDVATEAGLPDGTTGFGETLHVWGFGEGAYVESPILGPSTERDRAGRVVDVLTNPLRFVLDAPESYASPVTGALSGLNTRYELREVIDGVLYESADSYAQTRLLYLENRRFQLGGASALDDDGIDPFEDPFGVDPYAE